MKWPKSCHRTAFENLLTTGPQQHDIAEMNLLCAVGLNGGESLDIDACLHTLDRWTEAVRRYTQDSRSLYYKNPDYYHRHQGFFRFLSIATCLKHPKSLGLAYQPTAINNYVMKDSRDDFIHGLLTRHLGTCASFPVLFIAIGRRLGYPLFLSKAKHHFFCQ